VQSTPSFKRNKACYYTFTGPQDAKIGDMMYLKVVQSLNVQVVVTMAVDMDKNTPLVVCNFTNGSIVARYPQKLFVSFVASNTGSSAFFFTAYYAKTPSSDLYINADVCDDKG